MTLSNFRRWHVAVLLVPLLGSTLMGCAASGPAGPTVMALPPQGESFALFQQHDGTCRDYAASQTGGRAPGQAAARDSVGGAAVGAGLGAAAGALLGSASGHAGGGAAIGAGTGLLAGTLIGSARGRNAASLLQGRYNMSYTQCMVANGETIAPHMGPRPVAYVAAPPPPVVYMPAPVYPLPPPPPAGP
jgi:hypothetical protein